jgi:hypothetical protein
MTHHWPSEAGHLENPGLSLITCIFGMPADAQDSAPAHPDCLQISITPYLWATALKGDVGVRKTKAPVVPLPQAHGACLTAARHVRVTPGHCGPWWRRCQPRKSPGEGGRRMPARHRRHRRVGRFPTVRTIGMAKRLSAFGP